MKTSDIKTAVNPCAKDIGIIKDIIQDDIVIAAAIRTNTIEVVNAFFNDISNLAIFSKAIETKVIARANPITDMKSIFPTNLKAKPIANTATAIKSIVPTPFLILLSFFLSPPTSSKTPVFLSVSFFFPDANIVC